MAYQGTSYGEVLEKEKQVEIEEEKGFTSTTTAVVTEEAIATESEPRPGHKIHYGIAVADIIISLAPLYFVVFAILADTRDGSLASSFRNMAILRMAKLNPTLFPIVFTLIITKFLKAAANWKLERGATVGLIQHLLGSRSLVSSVMTPVKLRAGTLLVPLLVLMWILNPIGGQTSLRVVSKQSNFTEVDTPFYYLDTLTSQAVFKSESDPFDDLIDVAFNSALASPKSMKNGSQDIFLNLHIPMIEHLQDQYADSDGWIITMDPDLKGVVAAIADALDVPKQSPQLLYSSLLGIPLTRGGVVSANSLTAPPNSTEDKLNHIMQDLFGSDIVSTQSLFSFETSYLYANCSVAKATVKSSRLNYSTIASAPRTNWGTAAGPTASNRQGFTIAYNGTHNSHSTVPRRMGIESWMALDSSTERYTWNVDLSEAWCDLTTTYVEVQAYCTDEANCTVSKLRPSRKSHPNSRLTVFDVTGDGYSDGTFLATWFGAFVNSTPTDNKTPHNQVPLEAYFHDTVSPYLYATQFPQPLHDVGNELFSMRFTQLLNTYWLATAAPYTLVEGIDYYPDPNNVGGVISARDGNLATSAGNFYIETVVLRCHRPYLVVLMSVSIMLFVAGLITAYLDATRRGPDVLDDFVNSLRHSPYVQVDQGPSMEDGKEKARRLKETVIQIGDVSPGGEYGYVAIGTPGEQQPVEKLTHTRYYR